MSLRTVAQADTVDRTRTHRMERVIVTSDGDIFAQWVVELPNGKRAERSVQVGPALRALIIARATFQTVLENVKDDTSPRLGV